MVLIRFAIIQVLIRKLFRYFGTISKVRTIFKVIEPRTRKRSSLDDDPFSGVEF